MNESLIKFLNLIAGIGGIDAIILGDTFNLFLLNNFRQHSNQFLENQILHYQSNLKLYNKCDELQ